MHRAKKNIPPSRTEDGGLEKHQMMEVIETVVHGNGTEVQPGVLNPTDLHSCWSPHLQDVLWFSGSEPAWPSLISFVLQSCSWIIDESGLLD